MRNHILALAFAAFALSPAAYVHAEPQDKAIISMGAVSFTAGSGYVQFFRPDGNEAIPVTYTASTLVQQGIFIERMLVFGVSDTAAVTFSLLSTDATVTAGTNEKLLHQAVLSSSYSTNLNNVRIYDFTSNGTSKGLKCPKWPAIRVDSGTNTPVTHIFWTPAPKNKTQGSAG